MEFSRVVLGYGPMHGNASGFGIILAGWGAGAFAGALVAGALGKGKHKGLIMLIAGLFMAALTQLLPPCALLLPSLVLLLAVSPWTSSKSCLFSSAHLLFQS